MIVTLKKYTLSLLLLSMQSAIAGSMGVNLPSYDGFYLGGDIGVSNLANTTSTTYPLAGHHMSSTGIVGGGLMGYDHRMTEHITLGIEGFGNANGINTSSLQLYAPPAAYRFNARYNAGIRILSGYLLNSGVVGHVLLGYTNAKFNLSDNGNYGYINQGVNKSGFQCGLGMKVPLLNRLTLRADALYSIYANASNTGISNLAPYGPQTYHNNVSTLEGDLTLVYKFTN